MPERKVRATAIKPISDSHFEEFNKGTDGREVSTTMVFVRLLAKLLRQSRHNPKTATFLEEEIVSLDADISRIRSLIAETIREGVKR